MHSTEISLHSAKPTQKDVPLESVRLHNHDHYHKEVYHHMMNKAHSDFFGYDEEGTEMSGDAKALTASNNK
eukprot:9963029-Ditylum_brightwellii.AAC.1